jgi:hypothetical protein
MNVRQLLTWQWRGYATYHQYRTNLLLHIVAVPLFWLASVLIVVAAFGSSVPLLVAGIVGLVLSVAIQRRGHRLEAVPPEPFAGLANFVGRLFVGCGSLASSRCSGSLAPGRRMATTTFRLLSSSATNVVPFSMTGLLSHVALFPLGTTHVYFAIR